MSKAKPFLKWAGGKGQLIDKLTAIFPAELAENRIETYIEPFVGGGAVLFEVIQNYIVQKCVIIDVNKELINCYRCIKADVNSLISILKSYEEKFLPLSQEKRTEFYYQIRDKYNTIKLNGKYDFEKAADFIFLNRTCFNGLYRVNKSGEFNVPFGKYKNPKICDAENLSNIGVLLQKVEIIHGDYYLSKPYINERTMIYFDPPYRPIVEGLSFVGYDKGGFADREQIALANFYKEASSYGAKLLLSNSDPKNANSQDEFFDELYKEYTIERIFAKRMINCQADKRGEVTEIVVRNY